MLGTLAGGRIADRIGMVGTIQLGNALLLPFAVLIKLGPDYLPTRPGTAAGVTLGLAVSAGGLFLPILGLVADEHGPRGALIVLAALPLVAIAASTALREPLPNQLNRPEAEPSPVSDRHPVMWAFSRQFHQAGAADPPRSARGTARRMTSDRVTRVSEWFVTDTCRMAPLATTDQTARIMLQVTATAFVVSEVSIRIRSARRSAGLRVDRGSVVAVVLSIGAALLVAIWCATSVSMMAIPGDWPPFVVGIALMLLGIALREWAVLALGRFFTVVVRVIPEQTVVDRGPYRWVRHPSYTGLLLTLIGLGLALGNWLSLLALAILPTIGLVVRIRIEEQALLSVLGDRYRGYAEHRPRLIPGLW